MTSIRTEVRAIEAHIKSLALTQKKAIEIIQITYSHSAAIRTRKNKICFG